MLEQPASVSPDALDQAFLGCWLLDGEGGAQTLTLEALQSGVDALARPLWIHLKRDVDGLDQWLNRQLKVPEDVCDALLAEDTRPRCDSYREGVLLNLRGINLNEGMNPDDTISLRMWITPDLLVTLRKPRLMAASDVSDQLQQGRGARTVGQLVTRLADALTDRMGGYLETLGVTLDDMEEVSDEKRVQSNLKEIAGLRGSIVVMRRFIAPQLAALNRLVIEPPTWLHGRELVALRNVIDQVTRYVEDLDAMRDRASIVRDNLAQLLSERMNRNMYLLSVVAGIFLPLGLLTGLLGINVGGMPGTNSSLAFWVVCALLVFMTLIEWLIFRRLKVL